MSRKDKARGLFKEGANCAQAVFGVFADDLGLTEEAALRVTAVFGGGICSSGATCGAVTGAFMALGLRHGVATAERPGQDEKTAVARARELARRFMKRNMSTQCNVLLGHDISTAGGMSRIQAEGLFGTRCIKFVEDAVEIAEELM